MAKAKDAPAPAAEQAAAPATIESNTVLQITAADLQAIITGAVQAALSARQESSAAELEARREETKELAHAITTGIAANAGIRRMTVGERIAKGLGRNPFNPTNRKRELKWEFYQNGAPMYERYLHDSEIEMLHKLTPGIFLEGMVEVVVRVSAKGRKQTFIKHDDDRDGRIKLYSKTGNFNGLLRMLIAEAEQQKEARKEAARRLLAGED